MGDLKYELVVDVGVDMAFHKRLRRSHLRSDNTLSRFCAPSTGSDVDFRGEGEREWEDEIPRELAVKLFPWVHGVARVFRPYRMRDVKKGIYLINKSAPHPPTKLIFRLSIHIPS